MKNKMSAIVAVFSIMSVICLGCGPSLNSDGSVNSVFAYVDHDRTLAEMIKAGKYDFVYYDKDIVEKNFPIHQPSNNVWPPIGIEFVLVHLDKTASTNEVFQYMDEHDLWPAWIEELLAFGEEFPDVQRDFPIIAFGSSCVASDGYPRAPYLANSNGFYRYLSLTSFLTYSSLDDSPVWHESCRFLAVHK